MLIDAQCNNYSKELRCFLLLKLLYPCGKLRLDNDTLQFIEYIELINSRKTLKKYIAFFQEVRWLIYNAKTEYYIIKSFDKIRAENDWFVRLAFQIGFNNYYNIQAVTGAVIYGYLHKDFWRWVREQKSVQIKGCTYHFLSPKFNYKEQLAPVSVIGVSQIFSISQATASRLKNIAAKHGLIKLQKNYSKYKFNKAAMEYYLKYNDKSKNIVYRNGGYQLQLIDTIYPLFYFARRKSL